MAPHAQRTGAAAGNRQCQNRCGETFPPHIKLPIKDRPILRAAISGRATHLLTGDRKHFGCYFDQTIDGVLLLLPATYLNSRT